MDDTDRQLVALLRDDARMPVALLAKKLRVARATVQNRISKLEANGTIVGYTVLLRPQAVGVRIRATMCIEVNGGSDVVRRSLLGNPSVVALHTTNGRWDLVAELRADNLETFDRVLDDVRLISGIAATETSLLLTTLKAHL